MGEVTREEFNILCQAVVRLQEQIDRLLTLNEEQIGMLDRVTFQALNPYEDDEELQEYRRLVIAEDGGPEMVEFHRANYFARLKELDRSGQDADSGDDDSRPRGRRPGCTTTEIHPAQDDRDTQTSNRSDAIGNDKWQSLCELG